jgi:hypothetical protein
MVRSNFRHKKRGGMPMDNDSWASDKALHLCSPLGLELNVKTRNTKLLLLKHVQCSACDRDDVPVYPLPYTDSFGDQVNLCEVCIKTGWEAYQRYMKWATCKILESSGSVKGIEKLKNYEKLKAKIMAP